MEGFYRQIGVGEGEGIISKRKEGIVWGKVAFPEGGRAWGCVSYLVDYFTSADQKFHS